MSWTDFFINNVPGSKVVASAQGAAYISHEIAFREYVEVELVVSELALPFHVSFRRYDAIGGELENRLFAQVGEKTLALKSMKDLTELRLNSNVVVIDSECS